MSNTCVTGAEKNTAVISSLIEILNEMTNPIAVTLNLRNSVKASKNIPWSKDRRVIFFNDEEREKIYSSLRNEFQKQVFHSHERKSKGSRHPIIIGNTEYGSMSDQPHIHFVVDIKHTVVPQLIVYLINRAIEKARSTSRFVTDGVDIQLKSKVDSGWINYLCKFSTSNLLLG